MFKLVKLCVWIGKQLKAQKFGNISTIRLNSIIYLKYKSSSLACKEMTKITKPLACVIDSNEIDK